MATARELAGRAGRNLASPGSDPRGFVFLAGGVMFALLAIRNVQRPAGQKPGWSQVWALMLVLLVLAAAADVAPRFVAPFALLLLLTYVFAGNELSAWFSRIARSASGPVAPAGPVGPIGASR